MDAAAVVEPAARLLACSLTLIQAAGGGNRASFHPEPRSKLRRAAMQFLIAGFHLVQPAARLLGRIQHGMGPWSWKGFIARRSAAEHHFLVERALGSDRIAPVQA